MYNAVMREAQERLSKGLPPVPQQEGIRSTSRVSYRTPASLAPRRAPPTRGTQSHANYYSIGQQHGAVPCVSIQLTLLYGLCIEHNRTPTLMAKLQLELERHVPGAGACAQLSSAGRPFLNGINVPWIEWGSDFVSADNDSANTYCGWEEALRFAVTHGGNALRVWLFDEPQKQLLWHADGRVRGLAPGVTLMVQTLLALAEHYGCHVVLVLFNGADAKMQETRTLVSEERVLDSLLTNAVGPLAAAVRGYRSLAVIEIVNEPEGMIDPRASSAAADADAAACGSVEGVSACAGPHDAVGWSTYKFPLATVQRLVNRVAGAIRAVEPGVSLTVGSWHVCASWAGEAARTRGARHLFSNACLVAAGGDATGTLDLYQVHAYPKEEDGTDFGTNAPVGDVGRTAASLGLGAPVILGEVSSRWDVRNRGAEPTSTRHSMATLHTQAVELGYAGIFSWAFTCDYQVDIACVSREERADGLRAGAAALAARDGRPANLANLGPPPIPPPARIRNYRACDCADRLAHVGNYSCQQQASWGKCGETWMSGCTAWCANCGEPLVAYLPPPVPPPCYVPGTWDDESAEVAAMHHAVSAPATYGGLDLGMLLQRGVVGLAVGLVAVGLVPSRCGRAMRSRDYRKGAQMAPPESPEGEVEDSQAAAGASRRGRRS